MHNPLKHQKFRAVFFLLSLILKLLLSPNGDAHAENLIYNSEKDDPWLPLTYILNGTFDVTQNQNWFPQNDFENKNRTFWRRMRRPGPSLNEHGGLDQLIQDEFLSDRVAPNIFLHTLGGGYDILWIDEYYRHHGIRYSFALSVATTYVARVGNEIFESTAPDINAHDHIADLFFYDVMGAVIAGNDRASRFLVMDLGMRAWHFQPFWDADTDDFVNPGLNYVIRPAVITERSRLSPFLFMGMQNLAGLSYYRGGGSEEIFSAGAGVFFTDPLKREGRLVTGLFYETQERLAASLLINGSENLRWRLNLHPMLFKSWRPTTINLGLLLAQTYQRDYGIGINFNLPFGFFF